MCYWFTSGPFWYILACNRNGLQGIWRLKLKWKSDSHYSVIFQEQIEMIFWPRSCERFHNACFLSAMQNLAAITNLPGYVGGLNPEQFRFAQATGAAAAAGQTAATSSLISDNTASNLGGIWPGIQQSPVNMVPFQIPSIKLESSLSWSSSGVLA